MQYIGIHTQQMQNNVRSVLLLCLFPCLVVFLTFLFSWLFVWVTDDGYNGIWEQTIPVFRRFSLYMLGGIALWFVIAYFTNAGMIRLITRAHPLERKDNKRVYNLVENLCMSQGMKMPRINIINEDALNAFASGIDDKTYTITLSRGIINQLDDDELEAVIAHELSHIRNRDVRLLIISIVFVGIFSMLTEITIRMLSRSTIRNHNNRNNNHLSILLIALLVTAIGYFFASLMRFAISRNREYMADAGSAEMTRRPQALANALKKIAKDPYVEALTRDNIAQLFIEHPDKKKAPFGLSGMFATHPPIEERIRVLEQF